MLLLMSQVFKIATTSLSALLTVMCSRVA